MTSYSYTLLRVAQPKITIAPFPTRAIYSPVAKDTITEPDKTRVINAIRTAPSADIGLPSVSVGWRCDKAGIRWAEIVLEQLLIEKRVVKIAVDEPKATFRTLWRLA